VAGVSARPDTSYDLESTQDKDKDPSPDIDDHTVKTENARVPVNDDEVALPNEEGVTIPLVLDADIPSTPAITFRLLCHLSTWWLPELAASILSIVSLFCIVVISPRF